MLALLAQAGGLFAVTNIDALIVLAALFGTTEGPRRIVFVGQYLGFGAILAVACASSLVAGALPQWAFRCLGFIPVAIGLRLAWLEWAKSSASHDLPGGIARPTVWSVAAITFANGGDNISTYALLFAAIGVGRSLMCCAVFLVLVAVWCVLGLALATRPVVARAVTRGGGLVLPFVLILVGAVVLFRDATFGNTPL
jgi:cadmium resistance protein CadD (predicted permease)